MSKTVYVVGGDKLVEKIFKEKGWKITSSDALAEHLSNDCLLNLVCFTGGADVSPYLYGEENISSHCNPVRDEFEREIYESFVDKVPMVGICRGGQFLNVMNGGKMIQHIDGHHMGHRVIESDYIKFAPRVKIHEDHHQGIVPTDEAHVVYTDERDDNAEVVWYEKTRCLCFQPHPEWGHEPTKELFFKLIEEYIG